MELGLFVVIRITFFILLSIFFIVISWRSLHNFRSHGFHRFFAFEAILALILLNIPFWIKSPLSPLQLVSWVFLCLSIYFVFRGYYLLRKRGGHAVRKNSMETFNFEDTAVLVTNDIYKYIRHPMYSSLLLLAWGAYLKHISFDSSISIAIATTTLFATAKFEERENILFFGSEYEAYMKKSKMFIPYLF